MRSVIAFNFRYFASGNLQMRTKLQVVVFYLDKPSWPWQMFDLLIFCLQVERRILCEQYWSFLIHLLFCYMYISGSFLRDGKISETLENSFTSIILPITKKRIPIDLNHTHFNQWNNFKFLICFNKMRRLMITNCKEIHVEVPLPKIKCFPLSYRRKTETKM